MYTQRNTKEELHKIPIIRKPEDVYGVLEDAVMLHRKELARLGIDSGKRRVLCDRLMQTVGEVARYLEDVK